MLQVQLEIVVQHVSGGGGYLTAAQCQQQYLPDSTTDNQQVIQQSSFKFNIDFLSIISKPTPHPYTADICIWYKL